MINKIDKFCTKIENKCLFLPIKITPSDASFLVESFLKYATKHELQYYNSEKALYKINKYKNMYINNTWNSFDSKYSNAKSVIIFFKDDIYQTFSEGRHRLMALSKLNSSEISNVSFLCVIGWPFTLNILLKKRKEFGKNFHHCVLENCINKFVSGYNIQEINCCDIISLYNNGNLIKLYCE